MIGWFRRLFSSSNRTNSDIIKEFIDSVDDEEPQITAEREPIVDALTTDKEVKVIVEVPGINKENIKVNAYDTSVEISAIDTAESKRYHRLVDLPSETDTIIIL